MQNLSRTRTSTTNMSAQKTKPRATKMATRSSPNRIIDYIMNLIVIVRNLETDETQGNQGKNDTMKITEEL